MDGIEVARRLVRQRFPAARAAWLGGSVATGNATATSDLDITVLLAGPPAPFRESTSSDGWPVEWFVQTEESLMRFCAADIARRRPTTMRLVGTSVVLLDADGSGAELQARLRRLDDAGPPQTTHDELETARYLVTDLLDDLTSAHGDDVVVLAAHLWMAAAELVLLANGRWSGSGKWLVRELRHLDDARGTTHGDDTVSGLCAAGRGDVEPLRHAVGVILTECGGRMFDGYRRE